AQAEAEAEALLSAGIKQATSSGVTAAAQSDEDMNEKNDSNPRITLVGAGTIGLSFAALHLQHLSDPSHLTIYDTRPDLSDHVLSTLPRYLPPSHAALAQRVRLASDLSSAVSSASIIQEQGPENL
ncbi:hypothetical protein LTR60_008034, partial [Cryomyces antarcticus]